MSRLAVIAVFGMMLGVLSNRSEAAPPASLTEQPRSYGYVIGDVLTQRIEVKAGATLDTLTTPPADRVGQWLERRRPRLETGAAGQRWLVVEYQIINAPRELISTALPALSINSKDGPPLIVPAWPISVGPISPPEVFGLGTLNALQGDHAPSLTPLAPLRRRITLGLMALLIAGTAWPLWLYWRNQQDSHRLPFARAARQLARLRVSGSTDSPEAWIVLHRAFNTAAGQAVQSESLDILFTRAPGLARLRGEIETFYRHSSERFFARTPTPSTFSLADLCRQLHRIEKSLGGARGV